MESPLKKKVSRSFFFGLLLLASPLSATPILFCPSSPCPVLNTHSACPVSLCPVPSAPFSLSRSPSPVLLVLSASTLSLLPTKQFCKELQGWGKRILSPSYRWKYIHRWKRRYRHRYGTVRFFEIKFRGSEKKVALGSFFCFFPLKFLIFSVA
jgi:hypothetical protein